ncbi:alcohol dehydrogenase catalytic domain-containing protein [Hamadaea sp. NPDC051192]|uniref:alcohol dehydrogenase catalytic domain-containing protein n=1 Tax=Hamadaea sp. NPDC051192 TaxID=3154940 RepID=UPI00343770E5
MTDETEAFIITAPRQGRIGRWPLPRGEVTIKVHAVALCQRDSAIWAGDLSRPYPTVVGHEVVGEVIDSSPDTGWEPGTLVAGMGNQGLARFMQVPAWQIAPVAGTGPHLALVEPLACAINAVDQDPSTTDAPAIVFGLGLLGQLIAAVLQSAGRETIAVDSDAQRLTVAEAAGVTVVNSKDHRSVDRAISRASAAYECTADQQVLWKLSTTLQPGSALIIVAHHRHGDLPATALLDGWHQRGIAIRNPVPWTSSNMAECVRTAARQDVDLTRYAVETGDLADAPRLLSTWPGGEIMRHIVVL